MSYEVKKLVGNTSLPCDYCSEIAIVSVEINNKLSHLCRPHVMWLVDEIYKSIEKI